MFLWIPFNKVLYNNFQNSCLISCSRKQSKTVQNRCFIVATLLRVFIGDSSFSPTAIGTHVTNVREGITIYLEEEETQHLRARRVKENQVLEVFDGSGYVGRAIFLGYSKGNQHSAKILIQSWAPMELEEQVKLTIGVGVPKGKRGDWLIEKLTEIGVDSVIPVLYTRTNCETSLIDGGRKQRWQKICISACKQCCRNNLLKIEEEQSFRNIISQQQNVRHWDKVYVASMDAACPPFLPQVNSTRVLGLIGPEGGLTPEEEEMVSHISAHFIKLNRYTLRVETAATVLASLMRFLTFPTN